MDTIVNQNNLDYEFALYSPHYLGQKSSYQKFISFFEYVYFFIEKSPTILASQIQYPKDYLHYLTNLGLTIPVLTSDKIYAKNWWGNLENLSLERFLNSKITSTEIAQKKGLCPPNTEIIYTLPDLLLYITSLKESKLLIKSPFLMSGRGNFYFNKDDPSHYILLQKKCAYGEINFPVIVDPMLSIILEIGNYFNCHNDNISFPPLTHQNFLSTRGVFRGGLTFKNFSSYLLHLQNFHSSEIANLVAEARETTSAIASLYQKMGAKRGFGIDSFIYQSGHQSYLYPLLEVNYRNTMGLMIHSLKNLFPDDGVGSWMILPLSKKRKDTRIAEILKQLGPLKFNRKNNGGVILTSPPNCPLLSFYLISPSFDALKKLTDQFKKLVNNLQ